MSYIRFKMTFCFLEGSSATEILFVRHQRNGKRFCQTTIQYCHLGLSSWCKRRQCICFRSDQSVQISSNVSAICVGRLSRCCWPREILKFCCPTEANLQRDVRFDYLRKKSVKLKKFNRIRNLLEMSR